MNRDTAKFKITPQPLQRQQLIFYYTQKFTKRNYTKKNKSPPHRAQTQPISQQKITLVSKSKPILSFKANNEVNKNNLSNIEIFKKQVQYLEQENIEKYEMKSKNLDVLSDQPSRNTTKSQLKDNLHKTTIENWRKALVQRQIQSKLTNKKVNTKIANFTPLFHHQFIKFTNNRILNANTMYLPRTRNTTSVARKYFGSAKQINIHHSQLKFSERLLKNQRIRQKTQTFLSYSTFTL